MTTLAKPAMRPARPEFSSGPCAKRPGWNAQNLQNAVLGRSHRSKPGKARLQEAIDRTRWPVASPDDNLNALVDLAVGTDSPILIRAAGQDIGVVTKRALLRGIQGREDAAQSGQEVR